MYCLCGYADGSPSIDNFIRPAVICPPRDSIACPFDRINRQLSRLYMAFFISGVLVAVSMATQDSRRSRNAMA